MHAKLLQLYLTLCNPVDCSPPGSSVHGILQQEYWSGLPCPPPGDLSNPGIEPLFLMSLALAGKFFIASTTWEAKLSGLIIQLCPTLATPRSVACQAPLSLEFSRQE